MATGLLTRSVDWIALGAASRMIGVDPDTLRRWADEGRIEHLRTPGGHRRFRPEVLEPLVRAPSPDAPSLSRLGATPERLARVYRRRYQGQGPGGVGAMHFGPAERDAFRHEGRQLVAALLRHLDEALPAGGSPAFEEAATIVRRTGARLARAGIGLTDTVALFIDARRPFMGELGVVASRRRLRPDQLADVYERASSAFDRLLLELIEGHRTRS